MSKAKVFIVLMHKNCLKVPGTKTTEPKWEVEERVEFVDQLRKKHIETSSAIGNYLEQKLISGSRYGIDSYAKFDEYVRKKYNKEMRELDAVYLGMKETEDEDLSTIPTSENTLNLITDQFGNLRPRTIFDKVTFDAP